MPTTAIRLPSFATRLNAMTDEARLTALEATHDEYRAHRASWQLLLDAFEGRGGFLDGSYLWPYPREEDASFRERQSMARYHNYVETLVDLYVRFMFTQGVKRTCEDEDYTAWLQDVDGAGTEINDFLKHVASMALTTGHAGVLIDKSPEGPAGPTRADDTGRIFASLFTSTAIVDWRYRQNVLAGVKLVEAAPEPVLTEQRDPLLDTQYLLWDAEGWARYSAQGELIAGDVPALGLVPMAILRPKPSQLSRMLGRALVSNANVIRALFNRASEEDQVLRDQAFSVLTVEVPADGDVEQAKASIGSVVGTAKALIVKGAIKYETPSMEVPGTIRDNVAFLVQEVYRAAHVRFRRDSLAAESGESIRLQYTELNEMLQGFAKGLAQIERDIARAWYAWREPTPEAAQAAFERAKPDAVYPSEFFLDSLVNDLTAWADAIALNLGPTMTRRIKKRAVRRLEPDLTAEELTVVDSEIDAQPEDQLLPPVPTDFTGLTGGAGVQ